MQLIIDSHSHIGTYNSWTCPIHTLKNLMDSHGISHAVTADLSGNERGVASTLDAIAEAERFGNTFKVLVWINPACDGDFKAAEDIIKKYPSLLAGFKTHPKTAGIRLDDDRYKPYMEICKTHGLPFVSHTERDSFSNIEYLAKWASAYPSVNFVAVHMELFTDHRDSVRQISRSPNLYGDTTLVSPENAATAIETCGADKILFGSDAPVMGDSSYDSLEQLKTILPERFGREAADQVFFQNNRRIFHLDLFV